MMRALVLVLAIALAWCTAAGAGSVPSGSEPHQVLVLVPLPAHHFRIDATYGGGYADLAGRSAGRRIAAALARGYGLRMVTDWPLPAIGMDCYVMDVPLPLQAAEIATRLAREPGVAWAQVMNQFHALGHDDPLFERQPAARAWHLAELHRSAMGRGVRVAVIDSGVQVDHPDLAGRVAERMNFVADRPDVAELHGTAVAGIIAADADNHVGIVGVAPLAHVLALRACWQAAPADTRCSSLSLALALSAALEHDAQVINLSLAGPPDRLLRRLVETALARGISVVAARDEGGAGAGFPASIPGVIAVGDGDGDGDGAAAGLSAPGTDVVATLPGSRWGVVSGPSYAAAHVSGLVALVIEARARGGFVRVQAPVGPDLLTTPGGAVDACATLERAAGSCTCACGGAAMAQSTTPP